MGDFNVRNIQNKKERSLMHKHAIDDIETFEKMIEDGVFDTGPIMIGAEQEICLVDERNEPAYTALEILEEISEEAYTNELALFNLEINLDPKYLKNNCFSEVEQDLVALILKGSKVAEKFNTKFLLTGILPTLKYRHLSFDNMTPVERYKALSKSLLELRGIDFQIYLQGVDDLIISLQSVLFEACNTSFQLHLQIDPAEFVNMHNWSQMISGPVLSIMANSPLLFGNNLWAETRIALFKQSLDTRHGHNSIRRKLPRVYFGVDWLKKSPAEIWKNDLLRFPLIITSDKFQSSSEQYAEGTIPKLRAIRLHNGTTYTWNRMCYGFSGDKPHIRIECRYLPSGPTPVDEVANFAFWVGLMKAEPPKGKEFWKNMAFNTAKSNFIKAARTGLDTVFNWFGETISAKDLILDHLLPLAEKGLQSQQVDQADIDKYLSIIKKRASSENTGNTWIVNSYANMKEKHGETNGLQNMVQSMLDFQDRNIPVHEWNFEDSKGISNSSKIKVEDIMSTDIYSLGPDISCDFAKQLMLWRNIHHIPVEDTEGNLIGILTDGMIANCEDGDYISDVMKKDFVSIKAKQSISEVIEIFKSKNFTCLPVVYKHRLVGILTDKDILHVLNN